MRVLRQIVLDTETTGLEPAEGHRIIEIGCVELVDRRHTGRHYHQYINPERLVDAGAMAVHGITNEFLADKPKFAEIADAFFEFINGAELVIHNAAFDVGFINHEFNLLKRFGTVGEHCSVLDTLLMARKKHPGQKNNLDALCRRYEIDNSQRELHGALLDAQILADVYLAMTGGQTALSFSSGDEGQSGAASVATVQRFSDNRAPLKVIRASQAEIEAHEQYVQLLDKRSSGNTVYRKYSPSSEPN
ncbi:DNA polymerase III epsilon subunit [gamma proteobacterium HdN1]|nr:DNA polymerase III epsilon subunit [gamma proteobacterium HdN1]